MISRNIYPEVQEPFEAYLMAFFRGDTIEGEQIYFAISRGNNALVWDELNDGQPVLKSIRGTFGARDPFLFRLNGDEGFCLLSTDLSIGSGTSWHDAVTNGSRAIELWRSLDLVNWSDQQHLVLADQSSANAWAPKALYDQRSKTYIVYWSSSPISDGLAESYHRVYFSQTTDFINFSQPQVWIDSGDSVIDVSMQQVGDYWIRFSKDEGKRTACSDILMESSPIEGFYDPALSWDIKDSCIGQKFQLGQVEGPIALVANPGDENGSVMYLFLDQYLGGGYVPLVTELGSKPRWSKPLNYVLPERARHGSILPITARESAAIRSHFSTESGLSRDAQ